MARQTPGFARENDEDRLGDVLGQMGVAHLPQRGGINQPDVAFDQRGKGRLGFAVRAYSCKRAMSCIGNIHP